MKTYRWLVLAVCFLSVSLLFAQKPISYQAVVRDAQGVPSANESISLKFDILNGEAESIYSETHAVTTTTIGLVNVGVGSGENTTGDFAAIDWSADLDLQISVDPLGGQDFQALEIKSMGAVPFALYGEDSDADPQNELQTLSMQGDSLFLSGSSNAVRISASPWQVTASGIEYRDGQVLANEINLVSEANHPRSNANENHKLSLTPPGINLTVMPEITAEGRVVMKLEAVQGSNEGEVGSNITLNSFEGVVKTRSVKMDVEVLGDMMPDNMAEDLAFATIVAPNGTGVKAANLGTFQIGSLLQGAGEGGEDSNTKMGSQVDLFNLGQYCNTFLENGEVQFIQNFQQNPGGFWEYVSNFFVPEDNVPLSHEPSSTLRRQDGDTLSVNIGPAAIGFFNGLGLPNGGFGWEPGNRNAGLLQVNRGGTPFFEASQSEGNGQFGTFTSEGLTLIYGGNLQGTHILGLPDAEAFRAFMTIENGEGNFYGNGFFQLTPFDSETDVKMAALSGPENSIFERGTAALVNGEAAIQCSGAFQMIADPGTMTVILTPLSADSKGMAVIEKGAGGFKVKELYEGMGNYSFDWEVKCKRSDATPFDPVVTRDKSRMEALKLQTNKSMQQRK